MPRKNEIQSIIDKEMKSAAKIDRDLLAAWDRRLATVGANELNTLVGGTKIRTHSKEECVGYWCCIHNPSPHHMKRWPQYWDERELIMYRICKCGNHHPDPDDPNEFHSATYHRLDCCGCCVAANHVRRPERG